MVSWRQERGAWMLVRLLPRRVAGLLLLLAAALAGCGPATSPSASPQAGVQQQPSAGYAPLHVLVEDYRLVLTTPAELCNFALTADVVAGPPAAVRWNT